MNTHVVIDSRLQLAIPPTRLLAYYENPLVTQAVTNDEGLLLTLSIPMANETVELDVYKVEPVPMDSGNGTAIIWDFDSPYIAISRDGDSMTALSE